MYGPELVCDRLNDSTQESVDDKIYVPKGKTVREDPAEIISRS